MDTVNNNLSTKISALELDNNLLNKRLNRNDVVISGLPVGIDDLFSTVKAIGNYLGVNVLAGDLQFGSYINNNKAVLVKFVNTSLRVKLMSEYFKKKYIMLNNVIGGQIESRVYLNNHATPLDNKISYLCRKLLKLKKKF